MNKKTNILTVLTAFLLLLPAMQQALAEGTVYKEYEIKAAFMYQFINFIDGWKFQQEKDKDCESDENSDSPILIGIIGKNPFVDAFTPLTSKRVRNRKVAVRYFKGLSELVVKDKKMELHPKIEEIKQCDLLFICSSEKQYIQNILVSLRNESILTIADTQSFLEMGGIINFITEKNRIRFEINTVGAHRAKLQIRSKLLRLAKRVLKTDELS